MVRRAFKLIQMYAVSLNNRQAGAGNVLGSKFPEIGAIIRQVEDKTRVGVCLDTCE